MVRGYHHVRPLGADELTLLPELVLCRLVLSSLMTDYQIRHSPHIADLIRSERDGILASLERWTAVDDVELTDRLHDLTNRT